MRYPHIGLVGKARSGKDTVAGILTREFAYTRLAFADRLKEAAVQVDLLLEGDWNENCMRCWEDGLLLSEAVIMYGWETVKEQWPASRRFLQNLGVAMRNVDPDIWVRPVADQMRQGTCLNMPCVVTDVRFDNEVAALGKLGAVIVRITHPGTGGDSHVSETELDGYDADYTIENGGTLGDLADQVRELVRKLS